MIKAAIIVEGNSGIGAEEVGGVGEEVAVVKERVQSAGEVSGK